MIGGPRAVAKAPDFVFEALTLSSFCCLIDNNVQTLLAEECYSLLTTLTHIVSLNNYSEL